MQEDNHIFQGLKRKGHELRQDAEFLWDAHNIRLTNREDNSAFSITNERGTSDSIFEYLGKYVGHCVLNNYLVVFTARKNDNDDWISYIYRTEKKLDPNKENEYQYETLLLYNSPDLNLNPAYPIEAIADYETDLIQKVYWTDGVNSPRVINIATPELKGITKKLAPVSVMWECGFDKTQFDFAQILQLNETITVTKNYGGGSFSPGTIQYAFTYFNKYGSESSIFYTSPLQYISFQNRGGKEDESIANDFTININNADTSFQYIRIYSIHRSSSEGVPNVLKVADIPINSATLTYTDTGQVGEVIDQKQLLFIGGEDIVAGTMCSKDGTLFLGNIQIKRPVHIDFVKNRNEDVNVLRTQRYFNDHTKTINTPYYTHQDNLKNTPGFKSGEYYRLGIQFQYITGKWSDPIYIDDYQMPESHRPSEYIKWVPKITVKKELVNKALDLKCKRVRGLIVKSEIKDRTILAQGMLCPTVFNVGSRDTNSPFAQSSWFLRPTIPNFDEMSNFDSGSILKGASVQFKHKCSLYSFNTIDNHQVANRGAEIQCNTSSPLLSSINKNTKNNHKDKFFIDKSIVTFHSPDIEFDEATQLYLSQKDVDLRIVGAIPFTSNIGDINIQTASPAASSEAKGVINESLGNPVSGRSSQVAGFYYQDCIINDDQDSKLQPGDLITPYLVYPWHRNGSLNNDINRSVDQGSRTAELKTKVISNLKYSGYNIWATSSWTAKEKAAGITIPQIFNSNEVSLIKIPAPNNSYLQPLNYYGNVDTLIQSTSKYPTACVSGNGSMFFNEPSAWPIKDKYNSVGDKITSLKETNDPIRIKYKSTPHAVFALNYNNNYHTPYSLPYAKVGTSTIEYVSTRDNYTPFWENEDKYQGTLYLKNIKYKIEDGDLGCLGYSDEVEGDIAIVYGADVGSTWDEYALFQYRKNNDDILEWQQYVKLGTSPSAAYDYQSVFKYTDDNGVVKRYIQYPNNSVPAFKDVTADDIHNIYNENITYINFPSSTEDSGNFIYPFLYLAELYRPVDLNTIYGGNTSEAIQNNLWIPASEPVSLSVDKDADITFEYGDTWYSRYDCLKTYPFTSEDKNQIVEIGSFLCETRVNIDGRCDKNRGQNSNLHMTPANFNLINKAYTQLDTFFNYRTVDTLLQKDFKKEQQITWSLQKFPAMDVDPWTNITNISTQDMLGNAGPVTKIIEWADRLICFQHRGISQIMFNNRVQIPTSDGVPIEITNSNKVEGIRPISTTVGCQDKFSVGVAPTGIYFVDNYSNQIYNIGEGVTSISSTVGLNQYINTEFKYSYDDKYNDIYFIPADKDALCYSTTLQQFTSFMSYGSNDAMFNVTDGFYSLRHDGNTLKLYQNNVGNYNEFYGEFKPWNFTFISNKDPQKVKVFDTFEFRESEAENSEGQCPINYVKVENEYQQGLGVNIKKKFRVWRGIIPRNTEKGDKHRDRIRNTWTKITLGYAYDENNNNNNLRATIHDVTVKYTI